jgi:hypothetical protein
MAVALLVYYFYPRVPGISIAECNRRDGGVNNFDNKWHLINGNVLPVSSPY